MAITLLGGSACAQGITVDGRLSPAQTLAGPNYAIRAELGRQVGGNLFHSFGAFGLNQGETATFRGPSSVGNVIGRVTGGAASSINGGINSTIPGANVYLINPAGMVFGPNATVKVGGSFHAGSADYLRLKDGARFQATNPDASTLSAAPPEAFGFLSANPRPMMVDGSALQLEPGNTLGLVGGPVTISGGNLQVSGGTVHIASAAGPGEVPVDPRAGPAPTIARSGSVQVANKSRILVSGSGGSVFIRAGELSVAASNIEVDNNGPGPGGVLSLLGNRVVTVSGGSNVRTLSLGAGRGPDIGVSTAAGGTMTLDAATVSTATAAAGDGGTLTLNAGALTLRNGASALSQAQGLGNGGPINVAADSILLDGSGTSFASRTSGAALVNAGGSPASAGVGGSIVLTGGTLTIRNEALIETDAFGSGAGGSISAAMTGAVAIATGGQIQSVSTPSPVIATGGGRGGDAGAVMVGADTVTLLRGGAIRSVANTSGNAGEVALSVNGALTIDNAGDTGGFVNGVSSESERGSTGSAGTVRVNAGSVSVRDGGFINSNTRGTGAGGSVTVATPGALLLDGSGAGLTEVTEIGASALVPQAGDAGPVTVTAGTLTVQDRAQIASSTYGPGHGGDVTVHAGALSLLRGGSISSATFGPGNAGQVALRVDGALTIDAADDATGSINGVTSEAALGSTGAAGTVQVNAGSVSVLHGGFINSNTRGTGIGGSVAVTTPGALLLDGSGADLTEIGASAYVAQSGNAGTVTVSAGTAAVRNGARIASATVGAGRGGDVTVKAGALTVSAGGNVISTTSAAGNAGQVVLNVTGALTIDGANNAGQQTGVSSAADSNSSGSAGLVQATAGSVSVLNGGFINSNTGGTGVGGSVTVTTAGSLLLDGRNTEVGASALGAQSGGAGPVAVTAGTLTVQNGAQIASSTFSPGRGGDVTVHAGALSLLRGGSISSATFGPGNAGLVALRVDGALTIDPTGDTGGSINGVTSEAAIGSTGSAGTVQVNAGSVSVLHGGFINSNTHGPGVGGSVTVTTPGALLLDGSGADLTEIGASAVAAQSGNAGTVTVRAGAAIVRNNARIASATVGAGRGGDVTVRAGALTVSAGGNVISTTSAAGNAGQVVLNVTGALTIDGTKNAGQQTGVSSAASPESSGSAGVVQATAGSVSVLNGGFINSNTGGTGVGGSVTVTTAGPLLLAGRGTEIGASALGPKSGNAGTVTVSAGATTVTVQDGAQIASSTFSPGRGGDVTVNAGTLSLSRDGSISSATAGSGNAGLVVLGVDGALAIDAAGVSSEAATYSTGSAGTVRVNAGSVSVRDGGFINSNTRGTGVGGSVAVATPGALLLDGGGTEISASALGRRSGDAGTVTVNAGTATVQNGAQITSFTVGPGSGGNVDVTASSAIRLLGSGPQITATSTGTGNAGSITVSAPQVSLSSGASISTAAQAANGGNITIGPGDLLYLRDSSITTSVNSAFGNGGNITVDLRFVVLNRSVIEANAVGGAGGNVLIRGNEFVQSADSAVTATSQLGVSGQIFIVGPLLNLNSTLVVLASDLRSTAALLREGCAARGAGPRSSLVVAGRGGQRQGLEATLPALYFAHRPIRDSERRVSQASTVEALAAEASPASAPAAWAAPSC